MEKQKRNFDEGFDNILIYDYDREYQEGPRLTADTLLMDRPGSTTLLNGDWHFAPDVFHSLIRTRWFEETKVNRDGQPIPFDYSFDSWDTVPVPGVWNTARPEYSLYEGPGVYVRDFSYEKQEGTRVFLKIGAANYETRIWLNRRYLGRHLGGFTPMAVEVTEDLRTDGAENRLLISVDNTRRGDQLPSLHYDWFNYGGIFRNVELVETPKTVLARFSAALDPEKTGEIQGKAWIWGKAGHVEFELPELGICCRMEQGQETVQWNEENGVTQVTGRIFLDENALTLWSPDTPKLYQAVCRIGSRGQADGEAEGAAGTSRILDELEDRIGFRRIQVQGEEILLNGKPIFLKGICVHEESSEHQRAVTEADIRRTIQDAKELGCNFLRLTHYPHHERMAKMADEMGILLLEEIPVYWALEFANPAVFQDASNQLRELIRRDRNRASVIIWSVGNENPDTEERYQFMKRLAGIAREEDGSRLVGASCLIDLDACQIRDRLIQELDVVGINEYYGWYIRDFHILQQILANSRTGKPVIVTETGADGVSGMHSSGEPAEFYSEEYQAQVYRRQFEILLSCPYIRGITLWVLYDYASMRRMSCLQKGYNIKGVISADRKHRKLACRVLEEVYGRGF